MAPPIPPLAPVMTAIWFFSVVIFVIPICFTARVHWLSRGAFRLLPEVHARGKQSTRYSILKPGVSFQSTKMSFPAICACIVGQQAPCLRPVGIAEASVTVAERIRVRYSCQSGCRRHVRAARPGRNDT